MIIALSARWIVQSAQAAGWRCYVIDWFGDQETRSLAYRFHKLGETSLGSIDHEIMQVVARWFWPFQRNIGCVFGSGLEQRLHLLSWLRGQGLSVYGVSEKTFREIVMPLVFFSALDQLEIDYPTVSLTRPDKKLDAWLFKASKSSGGVGVMPANVSSSVKAGYYQKFQAGRSLSCLFWVSGSYIEIVGFHEQYKAPFSDPCFQFAGQKTLYGHNREKLALVVFPLLVKLSKRFELLGLMSLDMIETESGELQVLELNPRLSASAQLYEFAFAKGVVHAHISSAQGVLPRYSEKAVAMPCRAFRVLYSAREILIVGELEWPAWVHDRPVAGTRIMAGTPLVTITAEAESDIALDEVMSERIHQVNELVSSLTNTKHNINLIGHEESL